MARWPETAADAWCGRWIDSDTGETWVVAWLAERQAATATCETCAYWNPYGREWAESYMPAERVAQCRALPPGVDDGR